MTTQIKLGIVGSCGRGSTFKSVCDALESIEIHAICDVNEDALAASKESPGRAVAFPTCRESHASSFRAVRTTRFRQPASA